MAAAYENDTVWKKTQAFLPPRNRLTPETMPEEYYLPIDGLRIHIDHYRAANPKTAIILFHGVGGNGRLLSFIAVRLAENGYEVICPDLPLYGYTQYSQSITYATWVKCGCAIAAHYREFCNTGMFLFGLSAGGMLAYQVACECDGINGIIATCILDQRNPVVTKATAINPLMGAVGKPLLAGLSKVLGGMRIPMKMVGNMKAIANNAGLAKLLVSDKKSSGASVPIAFVHSMLNPDIKTEPEQFTACPFLLAHPGNDRWTDISLSRLFFDKLACEKELCVLESAGHFPIEERGLKQLEECCLQFIQNVIACDAE
jgi:alpha-beta hydrolase superfamily lysophospholipase